MSCHSHPILFLPPPVFSQADAAALNVKNVPLQKQLERCQVQSLLLQISWYDDPTLLTVAEGKSNMGERARD